MEVDERHRIARSGRLALATVGCLVVKVLDRFREIHGFGLLGQSAGKHLHGFDQYDPPPSLRRPANEVRQGQVRRLNARGVSDSRRKIDRRLFPSTVMASEKF